MLARLLDYLFPVRDDEAIVRDIQDGEFLALMAPEVHAGAGRHIVSLLPFTDERVRAAVHEAKYRGSERAFGLLALVLGEYLGQLHEETPLTGALLVPIPLGSLRERERGFNQVEEVLKRVAAGVPAAIAADSLVRTRETVSQISLPKWKRLKNMHGAFAARRVPSPARTYLIIDDVTTTGATLGAAAEALEKAGAENILLLAFAH